MYISSLTNVVCQCLHLSQCLHMLMVGIMAHTSRYPGYAKRADSKRQMQNSQARVGAQSCSVRQGTGVSMHTTTGLVLTRDTIHRHASRHTQRCARLQTCRLGSAHGSQAHANTHTHTHTYVPNNNVIWDGTLGGRVMMKPTMPACPTTTTLSCPMWSTLAVCTPAALQTQHVSVAPA